MAGLLGIGSVGAQSREFASSAKSFKYVIAHNWIDGSSRSPDSTRMLEVLLDEKAFSPETLKILFSLLSKRFPKPVSLNVFVATSLEQLDTPEEMEEGKISESGDSSIQTHPFALYLRDSDGESFRYSINPRTNETREVVIRPREVP